MKNGSVIIKDCLARGWIRDNNNFYPPNSSEAKRLTLEVASSPKKKQSRSNILKTGDTTDTRNIRNKAKHTDQFTRLIEIELQLEIWPEYFFTTERLYRLDYALPAFKIAIECDGGIHRKGASGHSSGTGIQRDMDKASLLAANGWLLIRRTPGQLITRETIELIKKAINQKL